MDYSAFFFLFVLVFPSNQKVYERSAGLVIIPKDMTAYIGDTVQFLCSNLPPGSVQWNFKSVASRNPVVIYTVVFGITKDFELGGRHHVELNNSVGTCSLAISNISRDDAGAYFCGTDHSTESANLVVIDSPPECKPNVDFSQVLVTNDCNIKPDLIDITCNLKFYGNIPPVLEWRHSNDPHVIRSNISHSASRDLATSRMTVQPDFLMNGTHFSCSVKDAIADEKHFCCMTPNISVKYFFNSSESLDISTEEAVNMSCVANTSERCNYRWQATDSPMEFHSQKLPTDILNLDLKNIRCLAQCTIHQQSCTAIPLVFNLIKTSFVLKESSLYTVSIPAVVIPLTIVLLSGVGVFAFFLIRWCNKRKKNSVGTESLHLSRLLLKKELNKKPDDSTDFTYDTIPKDNATVWRVAIRGLTVINTRIYYVCSRRKMVKIYDVERSEKLDAIHVHQLESPWCLVKCRNNRFLYISEFDNTDETYVYKIDLRKNDKVHVFQTRFKVSNEFNKKWVRISVAENNNVIVCGFESSKIEIYNQEDIKIETVQLDSSVTHLQMAMLLNEEQIAFIHGGWREDKDHRVCIVNRRSPQTIERSYGSRPKDLNKPTDIVVLRNGLICVADFTNNRVLVLNPDLTLKYKIRSKTNDKSNPVRLFIDDTEEYLYVGEDDGNISRLKLDQLLS